MERYNLTPRERVVRGESSPSTIHTETAITDYALSLRLINDGLAIFDRLDNKSHERDGLLFDLVMTELSLGNLDSAPSFARSIHHPNSRFHALAEVVWEGINRGVDSVEALEEVKETSREVPFLVDRAASLVQIAQLQMRMNEDPNISLEAARIATEELLKSPNVDFLSGAVRVIAGIGRVEKQMGKDPSGTFAFARTIAADRVPGRSEAVSALLYIAECELSEQLDPSDSLEQAKSLLADMEDLGYVSVEEFKFWVAQIESGDFQQVLPGTSLQAIREKYRGLEKETSYHYRLSLTKLVPNRGFRVSLNDAILAASVGTNPIPHVDAAKEKVILGTIKNNKTFTEYAEIAQTEIVAGLIILHKAAPVIEQLSRQDIAEIFQYATTFGNWRLITALGSLVSVDTQERWLKILPEESRAGFESLFFKGRSYRR